MYTFNFIDCRHTWVSSSLSYGKRVKNIHTRNTHTKEKQEKEKERGRKSKNKWGAGGGPGGVRTYFGFIASVRACGTCKGPAEVPEDSWVLRVRCLRCTPPIALTPGSFPSHRLDLENMKSQLWSKATYPRTISSSGGAVIRKPGSAWLEGTSTNGPWDKWQMRTNEDK